MATYPTAKVILTDRDVDAWYLSCERTLFQARKYWAHNVLQHFDWVTGLVHALRCKYWKCLFNDDFEANGRLAMESHYRDIRAFAKHQGRDVLELQLGDGWEPLCRFLGEEVPQQQYPKENAGEAWIVKMRRRAWERTKMVASKWAQRGLTVLFALVLVRLVASRRRRLLGLSR